MTSHINNDINKIYMNMNKCIHKYPHIKDDIQQITVADISRFLDRHGTPENTYKKLIEYLLWRSSNKVKLIKQSDFSNDIQNLVTIQKIDETYLTTINVKDFLKYDSKNERKLCIRYLVYICELLPKNKGIILIIDMNEIKISDIDLRLLQEILHITENYYPDLTSKVIFKNLPSSLNTIMKTVIGLMSENTKKKVAFA